MIDKSVLIKIVTTEKITIEDELAITNQLKLSVIEVGLLLNFYMEGEHKRKVFTNDIKNRKQAERTERKTEITDKPTNFLKVNKKAKQK